MGNESTFHSYVERSAVSSDTQCGCGRHTLIMNLLSCVTSASRTRTHIHNTPTGIRSEISFFGSALAALPSNTSGAAYELAVSGYRGVSGAVFMLSMQPAPPEAPLG